MKICFYFIFMELIILTFAGYVYAQAPVMEWLRTFDGPVSSFDQIKFIRLDAQQNVVVTGEVQTGAGATYRDIVTRKYDPDGNLLWSHTWNNSDYNLDDIVYDMEIAPNGYVIVVGVSRILATSNTNSIAIIYALDENGNYLWMDSLQGTGHVNIVNGNPIPIHSNYLFDLDVHTNGDIYVCGYITGNNVSEYERMFVAKYSASGVRQWFNHFDNSTAFEYSDMGFSMAIDGAGNVYVCGLTTLVTTWRDFVVWKIDTAGNFLHVATRPGALNSVSEQLEEIISDQNGNVYTYGINASGRFTVIKYDSALVKLWEYEFDTIIVGNTGSFTGADASLALDNAGNLIFAANMNIKMGVAKFSPNGNLLWLNFYGGTGTGNSHSYHVVTDTYNNIYVTGSYSNAGSSFFDVGVFKLDPNGNQLFSLTYDGANNQNDKGHSIAVSDSGYIYVGGFTTGATNGDYLLIKYAHDNTPTAVQAINSPLNVLIYPNPAEEQFIIQSEDDGVFELMDIHGKILQTYETRDNKSVIQVLWPAGFYLLRERQSGAVLKLLVE
ncbi:MAG: hypothetical protein KatS3mg031_0592 [Chitinophagales bacterium]|nr:MAG: hypothetical protein KatS3mg031_0592 [Chitinophagales bacterium]